MLFWAGEIHFLTWYQYHTITTLAIYTVPCEKTRFFLKKCILYEKISFLLEIRPKEIEGKSRDWYSLVNHLWWNIHRTRPTASYRYYRTFFHVLFFHLLCIEGKFMFATQYSSCKPLRYVKKMLQNFFKPDDFTLKAWMLWKCCKNFIDFSIQGLCEKIFLGWNNYIFNTFLWIFIIIHDLWYLKLSI